jgi:hypothetical protein
VDCKVLQGVETAQQPRQKAHSPIKSSRSADLRPPVFLLHCYTASLQHFVLRPFRGIMLLRQLQRFLRSLPHPRSLSIQCDPNYSVRRGPAALWRRMSARSTHSSNCGSSNGLLKKQTAPPLIARSRTGSCGKAVIKMIGTL